MTLRDVVYYLFMAAATVLVAEVCLSQRRYAAAGVVLVVAALFIGFRYWSVRWLRNKVRQSESKSA